MAYAAVTSLMGTLYLHFLQPEPRLPLKDKQELVSLYENLGLLQEVLEKSEIADDDAAMKDIEAEIRDVSLKAEESIEMELSTIYLAKGWTKRLRITACHFMLQEIFNEAVKQTGYLKNELIRVKSECQIAKASSQNERITDVSLFGSTSSSQPDLEEGENITVSKFSKSPSKFDSRMVGCDEEFTMILDQLMRQSSKQLHVVSIVGMGGIGKTTLARRVYEDPSITSHFDKRAWTTMSQDFDMLQTLRSLNCCVIAASSDEQSNELHEQRNELHEQKNKLHEKEKEKEKEKQEKEEKEKSQLAESVYKRLKGQRYLIAIDDIWSTAAWDSVKRCFPDDDNGSRILLTSRLREVAEYASSGNSLLNMPFLDANESWNLYCKVLGKTEVSSVFEQIGRNIVKKCKGLPLAIIVVASLLSKTEKVEKWRNVAENVSRFVMDDSKEACSRILSLSYNQLPHYLKACFLYFGIFPEDYEIPVKKLVKLWAAEGFLGAVKHRNPEEVAMECLQDLVDRSLVLVSKQSYNGKMKTIKIHDLLRDLCLREAKREKLPIDDQRKPDHSFSKPCHWKSIKRGCFNNLIRSKCIHNLHSLYSWNYFGYTPFHTKEISQFKLLRVLDMNLKSWYGGNMLENLVHLRYFALSTKKCFDHFHVKLFQHCNMQSFIVRGCGVLDSSQASGIWKMPLLRNFYFDRILSLETPEVVHRNLESISWLHPKCCTKDFFTRVPNFKKLGIMGRASLDCFDSFLHCEQLEKLSIRWWDLKCIPCSGIPWETSFLPSLKKLNFIETSVPWSDMRLIGMLPNLEVLKLIDACKGQKWEPFEGGFRRLKRLVIVKTSLACWDVVSDHFPVLECLELHECKYLQEIPSGFADITTLALIQLNYCCHSLLASAKSIQDEQQSYGNDALLVCSKNISSALNEKNKK